MTFKLEHGLAKLEQLKNSIPKMQGYIKERFDNTYQAYLTAMGKQNNNTKADTYFAYINDTKKMFKNGIDNPDEALNILVNALNSRHLPNEYAINYILAHNGAMGLSLEQQKAFEQIVPIINLISQENKNIENEVDKNNALIVPEKKLNIFHKKKKYNSNKCQCSKNK